MSSPNSSESRNSAGFFLIGGVVLLAVVLIGVLFGAALFIQPTGHRMVNPDSFGFSSQCTTDLLHCTMTLSNDAHSTHALTVKAFRSSPAGAVFSPNSLVLQPGASVEITITLPKIICPLQIILTDSFAGQPMQDTQFLLATNCTIQPTITPMK